MSGNVQSLSLQLNRCSQELSGFETAASAVMQQQQQQQQQQQPQQLASRSMRSINEDEGKFARLISKKASRVKELLLRNLGKSDKTTDNLFRVYEQNFFKQQSQAVRLSKEFKLHLSSLIGSREATRNLHECIQEATSDYQSARHDLVCENLANFEHLQEDFLERLREQVASGLAECLANFTELRTKIAKRHRKLIDYDISKRVYESTLAQMNKRRIQAQVQDSQHQFANGPMPGEGQQQHQQSGLAWSLLAGVGFGGAVASSTASAGSAISLSQSAGNSIQRAASQLVDEARLVKLREQYNYAKLMYESLNSELHDELPNIYERKMKNLLLLVQNYFSIQAQYHLEASKLFDSSADAIDELPQISSLASSGHVNVLSSSCEQVSTRLVDEYNKATSSSGMGSSRGESSSASSSSAAGSRSPSDDCVLQNSPALDDVCEIETRELDTAAQVDKDGGEETQQVVEASDLYNNDNNKSAGNGHSEADCSEVVVGLDPAFTLEVAGAILDAAEQSYAIETSNSIQQQSESVDVVVAQQVGCNRSDESCDTDDADKTAREKTTNKVLYKVKTLYKYLAEDVDELCFEADEIVDVVEFEPSQEQEDGWLMGVREVNSQKGLFPANFTQRLDSLE